MGNGHGDLGQEHLSKKDHSDYSYVCPQLCCSRGQCCCGLIGILPQTNASYCFESSLGCVEEPHPIPDKVGYKDWTEVMSPIPATVSTVAPSTIRHSLSTEPSGRISGQSISEVAPSHLVTQAAESVRGSGNLQPAAPNPTIVTAWPQEAQGSEQCQAMPQT